jgi:hypothetical protein
MLTSEPGAGFSLTFMRVPEDAPFFKGRVLAAKALEFSFRIFVGHMGFQL